MDNNTLSTNRKTEGSSPQDSAFGEPDAEYYFNIIVIKVGNAIFRVPRNGFDLPGSIFADMFSLPTAGSNIEGSSDSIPIVLPVSEEYFRGLLRAMYAINGRKMTESDWLGALDLSTMWRFMEIRKRAIRALDDWIKKQNAKEAVLLAKKYRIAHWLTDAYTRLLQQSTLTADGLDACPFSFDWETIARLLSAREAIRVINPDISSQSDNLNRCGNCGRSKSYRWGEPQCTCRGGNVTSNSRVADPNSMKPVIEKEFKKELTGMNDEYPETRK